ncbi:MAG: tRNA lysidine(34) synthetase TilS [Chitinispirillales bacterium]|jgi:tRNA(Ile)-lysidine synthase|nr:tRNA lysidine(34) synthetase TilS [Chitinispirillales bacterium]
MPNIHEITAFFETLTGVLSAPISVLVGVSGGADSVALFYVLHENRETFNINRLGVAHINHGLRGDESDGDEEFVKNIAELTETEYYRVKLDDPSSVGAGIEDWARQERYKFFAETMKNNNFDYTATAHTANDQAETVLMRLIRGTGIRGLRGILPVREDNVIRPLLNTERHELEKWLGEKGLTYRTDSTNIDDKYRRNFIRNQITPLLTEINPEAIKNIASAAENAARAWEIITGKVDIWIKQYTLKVNKETFHIEKEGIFDDKTIAAEAIISLFDAHGIPPSKQHITRVMEAVNLSAGEYLLPNGWKFYPREDRVCFVRS